MESGVDREGGGEDRFDRREMGALLRLFSSLGITVAAGILGFFLLGVAADRRLADMGWRTGGLVRIAFLLLGLGLSVYWAYLRIARHLDRFDKRHPLDPGRRSTDGDGK